MTDKELNKLLAEYFIGKEADDKIKAHFFPLSIEALDNKDVATLTRVLEKEKVACYKRLGQTAFLFSIRYSVGLRRIRAFHKLKKL